MASNHTTNYQLCQWEATDKVLRTDFNEDNAKIDAALASKGNCQLLTGSYIGTGTYGSAHPNTLQFPAQPLAVFLHGDRNCWAIRGETRASVSYGSGGGFITADWSDAVFCWYGDDEYVQMNAEGESYSYIALIPLG